ncbi:hypothetical protein Vafri_18448, partial [Volvox africanus]
MTMRSTAVVPLPSSSSLNVLRLEAWLLINTLAPSAPAHSEGDVSVALATGLALQAKPTSLSVSPTPADMELELTEDERSREDRARLSLPSVAAGTMVAGSAPGAASAAPGQGIPPDEQGRARSRWPARPLSESRNAELSMRWTTIVPVVVLPLAVANPSPWFPSAALSTAASSDVPAASSVAAHIFATCFT